ncbi:MAG: ABC transporter permease [Pseudomonadota bacterium]|jgi:peptide/nickel transport system permease protein|nr:ABC transporter permease [Burkholderiales bacterium]MCA3253874.1 ABC transporter permease [Rubrivivax sp.]MCA3260035.1 ABC transporter permease [Rubrivivax sp.]MCZ8032851.1 ABC transporter permease [Rubrivivax sp.]
MLPFLLRRLLQAALVLLCVAFVSFILFQYVGDPVVFLLGQDASAAEIAALRSDLGLDRPSWIQFLHFLGNAASGEFGTSLRHGAKVSTLLAARLPATLELSLVAAALALLIGVPAGVYTALRRRAPGSQALMVLSLLGVSLPTFLIGILMILVFSVLLGWLPSFGRGPLVSIAGVETSLATWVGWSHVVMPAATLAVFQVALLLRLVRAEMLEVLRTDYIKFARARGLPDRVVHFRHALRNTLVPVITVAGLQLGSLIAFAIITETVFQWPGMGLLFIEAVTFADIPVMAAYLCVVSLIFVAINLGVDLLYFGIDPRLHPHRSSGH